jgi:replicative DNA helicase
MKPKRLVPPHSLEAEQSVLGAVLLHAESALPKVKPLLDASSFYHPAHKALWEAILDCEKRHAPVDAVSVIEALRRLDLLGRLNSEGGEEYLTTLQGVVVTVENVEHHAQIVARKADRRWCSEQLAELVAKGYGEDDDDEFAGDVERLLMDVGARRRNVKRGAKLRDTLKALLGDLEVRMERARQGGTIPLIGIPTGFDNLDKLTGGWRDGDQIVIAARPSMGKTAFVMNAVTSAALAYGVYALVFSAEMAAMQLVERMVASRGRVDTLNLRNGTLVAEDMVRITTAATDLSELPIEIDDETGLTITDVQSRARRWRSTTAKDAGRCIIVLDYLQLLEPTNSKVQREQQVAEISRGMKRLAKECRCPVISLAQLNRELERRDDKRPRMSDLRDSGSIEQDADIVAFLYRDEIYDPAPSNPQKGTAELIVGKFRGGPLATLWFDWDGQHTTFTTRWAPLPSKNPAKGAGKPNGSNGSIAPPRQYVDDDGLA